MVSLPNPWVILAAATAMGMALGYSYIRGHESGKAKVYALWNAAATAKTEEKLDIKVKQDVIQNAPVDGGITARRMRAGTF